jgi:hypothetical protein
MTRSAVVMVWFGMKAAGEQATFAQIADTPGFPFADSAFTADDEDDRDGQSPPEPTTLTTSAQKPSDTDDVSAHPLRSLSGNG